MGLFFSWPEINMKSWRLWTIFWTIIIVFSLLFYIMLSILKESSGEELVNAAFLNRIRQLKFELIKHQNEIKFLQSDIELIVKRSQTYNLSQPQYKQVRLNKLFDIIESDTEPLKPIVKFQPAYRIIRPVRKRLTTGEYYLR